MAVPGSGKETLKSSLIHRARDAFTWLLYARPCSTAASASTYVDDDSNDDAATSASLPIVDIVSSGTVAEPGFHSWVFTYIKNFDTNVQ